MFAALESSTAKSGVFVQQMLKFKRDNTVFDGEFRPPTSRHDRPSHIQLSATIPVVVGGKAAGGPEDEKSAKWTNASQKERKKKPKTSDQMVTPGTPRQLRSGKVAH
ncbi:hypothetical protein DFH09DRAFT_1343899 [Mycena vulgaris]|nr:hypothetical protein DFH09DRAFT_1343899 [Mycena vulgaris]